MAKEDDVLIQLATRNPKGLHREIQAVLRANKASP